MGESQEGIFIDQAMREKVYLINNHVYFVTMCLSADNLTLLLIIVNQ